MQRKFAFDFIPNELYTPFVSNTTTKSYLILNLKNVFRKDFHPQPRGFSEFQFQIVIFAGRLLYNVWIYDPGTKSKGELWVKKELIRWIFPILQTLETDNSAHAREESIVKRQCRFPDERWPSTATLPYSFASCLTYLRVQYELDLCNCTIHTSPKECELHKINFFVISCS